MGGEHSLPTPFKSKHKQHSFKSNIKTNTLFLPLFVNNIDSLDIHVATNYNENIVYYELDSPQKDSQTK